MKQLVIALFIILLAATASQAKTKRIADQQGQMVSIAGQQVNMRSGPGSGYPVLWELGFGFPLKVIGKKKHWLRIKDFEGDTGWVHRKFTYKNQTVIVTKKRVNIRSGPSTKDPVVGSAEYTTCFNLLDKIKGWVKIEQPGGRDGWIKQNLVWGW